MIREEIRKNIVTIAENETLLLPEEKEKLLEVARSIDADRIATPTRGNSHIKILKQTVNPSFFNYLQNIQ